MLNKKAFTVIFILTALLFAGGVKPKKTKVTTKFLVPPMVEQSAIEDYAKLSAVYTVGNITILNKRRFEEKALCSSKTKISTPMKADYKISYQKPSLYILVKDASGKAIFAQELSRGKDVTDFAPSFCISTSAGVLERYYSKHKAEFISQLRQKELKGIKDYAQELTVNALFTHYEEEKFVLYGIKNDDGRYGDLIKAYTIALGSYKTIAKDGYSAASIAELTEAISLWDKALAEANLGDKTARINKKIAIKMAENLVIASLFLGDYSHATGYLTQRNKMSTSTITTSSPYDFSKVEDRALYRMKAFNNNPDIFSNDSEIRGAVARKKMYAKDISLAALKGNPDALIKEVQGVLALQKLDDAKKSIALTQNAQGTGTSYEADVTKSMSQGWVFMKTPMMAMGQKFNTVPLELCNITRLEQLIITSNNVASIPPEIKNLTNLNLINLKKNKLTSLPAEIGTLEKLTKLNLAENKITSLPESLSNLRSLKKLDLRGNPIPESEIKRLIAALPNCKIKY